MVFDVPANTLIAASDDPPAPPAVVAVAVAAVSSPDLSWPPILFMA
jgi:hypothetical protein